MKRFTAIVMMVLAVALLAGCGTGAQPITGDEVAVVKDAWSGKQRSATAIQGSDTWISPDVAKENAFSHAKVQSGEAYKIEIEDDTDDLVPHYEISFKVSNVEYDYDIDAKTGAVLKYEQEVDDAKKQELPLTSADPIAKDTAKAVAFKHAGVAEAEVSRLNVKLDRDDGVLAYEIEFDYAGYEYEYDIHAYTGTIVAYDKEIKD